MQIGKQPYYCKKKERERQHVTHRDTQSNNWLPAATQKTPLPLDRLKQTSKTVELDNKQDIKQDVGLRDHNFKKVYIKITNLKCYLS